MKPYAARPEHCLAFYPRGFTRVEDPVSGQSFVQSKVYLSGQYTHRINKYASTPEFLMILVVFHPGAVYRLTGIPASELHNRGYDLECIFPEATRCIAEQLANAHDYREMLDRIDLFLLQLADRCKAVDEWPVHRLMRAMVGAHTIQGVEQLAAEACLSVRQLERVFLQQCGISPGKMLQIVRFDRAYRLRLEHPEFSWLRIAMECGYHDYQHLAKAFREFAHASPNEILPAETMAPEHQLGLVRYA